MIASDQTPQDHNKVLAHLQAVLGQAQTTVDTPMAEALAAALEVDRRLRGDATGIQRQLELSADEITELGLDLNWALEAVGVNFQLPLGAQVTSGTSSGTILIDGEPMTLDAGRAGLFPVETTPSHAHGPNLVLLRSEIDRLTRKLECRRIGLPQPAQILYGTPLQIVQFPPLAEAGGVALQRSAYDCGANHFCAATPKQIKKFAREVVRDMRALWSRRDNIGKQALELREAAHDAIRSISTDFGVRAVGIEMKSQRTDTTFAFNVEYDFIDEAMRRGPYVQGHAYHKGDFDDGFHLHRSMLGLLELRNELNESGADGWIDDLALGVLNASPEGAKAVLDRLATSYETVTTIPTGGRVLYATLFWKRGTINVDIFIASQLEWLGQELDLLGVSMPEMTLPALAGCMLDSVVELPFECCSTISEATNLSAENRVRIDLDLRYYLINLETGRTWPEPEADA